MSNSIKLDDIGYRIVFEMSPDPVVITDQDGNILETNNSFLKFAGNKYQNNDSLKKFVSPQSNAVFENLLINLRMGAKLSDHDIMFVDFRDETVVWSLTAFPIFTDDVVANMVFIAHDVTVRSRFEEMSRQLSSIVESTDDAIISGDISGIISSWNRGAEMLFGYSEDEMIGRPRSILIPDGMHEEYDKSLSSTVMGMHAERRETLAKHKDGSIIPISLIVSPLKNDRGDIIGASAIIHDITARKKAENALLESQQKYHSVFNKANDFMVLIDKTGTIVEVNEQALTVLGITREDIVGKSITHLPVLGKAGKRQAIEAFKRRIAGEDVVSYELQFQTSGGEIMIGEVNASLVELTQDQVLDLVIIRDITKRKRAEDDRTDLIKQLREKTDEINTILESVGDAIVSVDTDYNIQTVNRAFCDLVGYSMQELIGRNCEDIMKCDENHDDAPCEHKCGLGDTLGKGTKVIHRSSLHTRHGTSIVIESVNSPLIDEAGGIIGAVKSIRDVTKVTEIESMKNEFISTVSHEVRTPLTSIRGYLDLFLDGDAGETTDLQREFLDIISQNTDRLHMLINDLLDIERIETGRISLKIQPVDASDLCGESVRMFEPLAREKGVSLICESDTPVVLSADPDRLMQIMVNLVSNAVKFTHEGSVRVRVRQQGDIAEISVRDSGLGISVADRKRLFEKFFRSEQVVSLNISGTGLGLAIVKQLVELMHGKIEVESEPGSGTEFRILLPIIGKTDAESIEPGTN
jgi:PAS domain S-box-containing protein